MTAVLRALTWNVRKAFGTDWRRDPARVVRVLAEARVDVAILQEADRRLGPRPPAIPPDLLHGIGLRPVAVRSQGLGWHGNAVLLGPGLRCTAHHPLDLPGLEPRGALLCDVDTPLGPMRVGSVHLGLTGGARRRQMEAIARHCAALPPRPTVLAGDWNEWRAARFAPLGMAVHAGGPTFHSTLPRLALDRVATGPDLHVEALEVVRTPDARRASDHLPLRFTLRPAAPPPP